MTTIRVNKNKNNPYVQIDKRAIQDVKLSWKAKGILAYLLSLPDDWEIYLVELEKHAPDGESSLRSGIKELEDIGYIEKSIDRGKSGKFNGYSYTVYEIPTVLRKTQNGSPFGEKPDVEKPDVDNHGLLINDLKENNLNTLSVKETPGLLEYFEEITGLYRPSEMIDPYKLINWEKEIAKWENMGATKEDIRQAVKKADEANTTLAKPSGITNYMKSAIARRKRGVKNNGSNTSKRKRPETAEELYNRLKAEEAELNGIEVIDG